MSNEPEPKEWPFAELTISDPTRRILERFWYQISQRRPFKHDFPDMYEKEPFEFREMFEDIADAIDAEICAARAEVERLAKKCEAYKKAAENLGKQAKGWKEYGEMVTEVERLRDSLFTPAELRRIIARAEKRPRNGQDIRISAKARERLSLLEPARAALSRKEK